MHRSKSKGKSKKNSENQYTEMRTIILYKSGMRESKINLELEIVRERSDSSFVKVYKTMPRTVTYTDFLSYDNPSFYSNLKTVKFILKPQSMVYHRYREYTLLVYFLIQH